MAGLEAIKASANIELLVPHAVSILFLQSKISFLSSARHLSCMAVLQPQLHLKIRRCTLLNPATLLPTEEDGTKHKCTPLTEGITFYVDGSSKKSPDGTNKTGYTSMFKIKLSNGTWYACKTCTQEPFRSFRKTMRTVTSLMAH